MALSVVKYPKGFKRTGTTATATYVNGSSTITRNSHGLQTGDTIYISTGQAIGFWYVTVLNINTFTISEYSGSTAVTFVGTDSFTFYTTVDRLGHAYSCVHLPIVYKLQSTLWPTNSVDTARTVSSFSNDNGYVRLTLSGALKSDVTELEFIKITGNQAGIYQIISWWSTSIVTIDLAYNSNYTWAGGTVQYYYRNYRAQIRVYAGIASSHYFAAQKPYTLITEQAIVPDSNGVVTLNINEFLKDQIDILKNNLNISTYPNNIDSWCNFYITYAEAYDYSAGGYGLMDYVGSYTTDSFTGVAVNAQLPFKNIHSGYLSDYIYQYSISEGFPFELKFLTPSVYPRISAGLYFDISFINQFGADVYYVLNYYRSGVYLASSGAVTIKNYGPGIYRIPISQSAYLEDRIDIYLGYDDYSGSIGISEAKTIEVDSTCYPYAVNLSWLNYLGGFDYWAFKGFADYGVNVQGTRETTKNIFPTWPRSFGEDADTIRQETLRNSNGTIVVRAENLTSAQVDDLYRIGTSPLVMIVNDKTDRKVVIPDAGSFVYKPQANKLFDLSFTLTLTEDLPAQDL